MRDAALIGACWTLAVIVGALVVFGAPEAWFDHEHVAGSMGTLIGLAAAALVYTRLSRR